MDLRAPTELLAGLSPAQFMRRHWQRKPLVVRQALPGIAPPLARAALFELAARDDVEARLVTAFDGGWRVRPGPLPRRALPAVSRPGWTLLVQGLDLHVERAHALLQRFRFIPDARLDDLMMSWASDGGGVGPHVDSYDVFLIQLQGRRRWRIGPVKRAALVPGLPLKILADFRPAEEHVLEPGDLLYLPPGWGHDGVALGGDCMTASVGFRAPARDGLARELLLRLADAGAGTDDAARPDPLYRDPGQPATATPAAVPDALRAFAREALARSLREPGALDRALGEALTEPKPRVWFQGGEPLAAGGAVRLDPKTRMLHDARHVFVNGESFAAGGRDASLMRRLADARALSAADVARLSPQARELLAEWVDDGWVRAVGPGPGTSA